MRGQWTAEIAERLSGTLPGLAWPKRSSAFS
jgi:hypothetical protein